MEEIVRESLSGPRELNSPNLTASIISSPLRQEAISIYILTNNINNNLFPNSTPNPSIMYL